MANEMMPKPVRQEQPDEIASPEEMRHDVALFSDIQSLIAGITPETYVRPMQEPLRDVRIMGSATDRIKQLYTLHERLMQQVVELNALLQRNGLKDNQDTFQELNRKSLQQRAVQSALGYEVSNTFHSFGEQFGIDLNWNIFTKK